MNDICYYRGVVDFGNGPVEVRCTEIGDHYEHKIFVILGSGQRDGPIHHNLFDDFEELDD